MIASRVGAHFSQLRLWRGETFKSLGRALDVSPELIQQWESGAEPLPPHRLVELAVLLNCKIMDFFVPSPQLQNRPEQAGEQDRSDQPSSLAE